MPHPLPTFRLKLALALALVVLADLLLFERAPGLNLGLFAIGWTAALLAANPAIGRSRLALMALAVAAAFGLLQIERPTLLGLLLFAVALGVAALAPRAATGEDAWRWAQRLAAAGVKALAGPVLDIRILRKTGAFGKPLASPPPLAGAVLPVAGGLVFLWLFSSANPVLADALARLRLPELYFGRLTFWSIVALAAWASLRPRGWRRRLRMPRPARDLSLPGVTATSIAASLVVFNAVFALQNGLDIAFLWSGARLPEGVTFAEYAHHGAYALIATALLAGLFVLVFLRPGAPTAAAPRVRWLVIAWVAQNVFLVASTILRTLDYVDVYALTRMRIAALLWMGLVALGLVLIGWRLVRGRSGGWLINANALAAGVVLAACSVVDLGAVAAAWNVRHAREVGGRGVPLDLCYLGELRGAALVSLAELEQRPLPAGFRDRVAWKRQELRAGLIDRQDDALAWRWRDARRLVRDRELGGAAPALLGDRDCAGLPIPARKDRPLPLTVPPKP